MKNKGEILAEKLRNYEECYFFLHSTKEFSIVEKIMNEGFIFESQLPHSTDQVNPGEPIEITYFLFQRKEYGHYTMVIAIPKAIYESYSEVSNKNETGIEEVLSITDPFFGENDELIYTLSPKHVLGFFNARSAEFVKNSNWDPSFNNTVYRKPARRLVKPDRYQ